MRPRRSCRWRRGAGLEANGHPLGRDAVADQILGRHPQPQQGQLPVVDEQPAPSAARARPVSTDTSHRARRQAADRAAQAAGHRVEAGPARRDRAPAEPAGSRAALVDLRHREAIGAAAGSEVAVAASSPCAGSSSAIARSRPSTRLHATPSKPTATSRARARMGMRDRQRLRAEPAQRRFQPLQIRPSARVGTGVGRRSGGSSVRRRSPARASAS